MMNETREQTWFKGDRAVYTGKVETLYGGTFYEVELVEGRSNGERRWVVTAPSSKPAKREYMGYEVEAVPNPENKDGAAYLGYTLTGKRGATYRLVRCQRNPHLMYVVNSVGNICGLKGNYTFTDEGGELRAR